jgi:hypothetical protein
LWPGTTRPLTGGTQRANAPALYIMTRLLLRCAHRNDKFYKTLTKPVIAIRQRRRSNLVAIARPLCLLCAAGNGRLDRLAQTLSLLRLCWCFHQQNCALYSGLRAAFTCGTAICNFSDRHKPSIVGENTNNGEKKRRLNYIIIFIQLGLLSFNFGIKSMSRAISCTNLAIGLSNISSGLS